MAPLFEYGFLVDISRGSLRHDESIQNISNVSGMVMSFSHLCSSGNIDVDIFHLESG